MVYTGAGVEVGLIFVEIESEGGIVLGEAGNAPLEAPNGCSVRASNASPG